MKALLQEQVHYTIAPLGGLNGGHSSVTYRSGGGGVSNFPEKNFCEGVTVQLALRVGGYVNFLEKSVT